MRNPRGGAGQKDDGLLGVREVTGGRRRQAHGDFVNRAFGAIGTWNGGTKAPAWFSVKSFL